jgi:hypothetical protein
VLRTRCLLAVAASAAALLALPGFARAAIVTNGDFETGNLNGWTSENSPTSTTNKWYAYSGTTTPFSFRTVHAPPQGSFAAITDQGGTGAHFLYQDVSLPPGGSVYQLSLLAYYDSAAVIASPDSLDSTVVPNQQYRIDVIRPTAQINSVSSGDVLRTVFRTLAGDPQTLDPVQKLADLTPYAGQTVRLRLAEVDNELFFNASADAIAINGLTIGKAKLNKKSGTAKLPVTVTDPGTVTLTGKGVKRRSAGANTSVSTQGGKVKLLVKPKGKTASKLNQSGKAKVKVTVTYTPNGASPLVKKKKLKLKKS